MRLFTTLVLAAGAFRLWLPAAHAERPDFPEGMGPPPSSPGGGPIQKRALAKMRTMRLIELQSALDLDEKTTLRLAEVFKRHDDEREKVFAQVRENMQALRGLVRGEKPDEAKISATLDKLAALRTKMHGIQNGQIEDARKVLTPLQQAKFVLHMAKFRKRMQEMVHRSWGKRGGPRPHGGPGFGPGGEDEF